MGCGKSVGRIVPYRIATASASQRKLHGRLPLAGSSSENTLQHCFPYSLSVLFFSIFPPLLRLAVEYAITVSDALPGQESGGGGGGTIRYSEYETHQLQGGRNSGVDIAYYIHHWWCAVPFFSLSLCNI